MTDTTKTMDPMEAREIVAQGGQILLPFDAGDAEVKFSSRKHLANLIAQALAARDAVGGAEVGGGG